MKALEFFSSLGIAELARSQLWYSPLVEYVHYAGHSLLFGCIFIIDLRLMGMGRSIAVTDLHRLVLRWAAVGVGLAMLSGLMIFLGNPQLFWGNRIFIAKLLLIPLALINIAIFHYRIQPGVADWNQYLMPPLSARLSGMCSLLLWASVMALGRLIAYF